ncbi:MAG: acyltransferase [Nocardioides sp.]|jgi:acetyltransferase-like isoleucine patch superfamily enzyme
MNFRRVASRALPNPEWLLNHVVNKVPYTAQRHRMYAALGVNFEDPSTGCLMLGVEVHSPHDLHVGRNVVVGPGALLDCRGGLHIGADVNITGKCRFMTAKHDVQDADFVASFDPIRIGDRAWIALGATVLGGVTIGEGAVVTANATVTKDVEPYTIVGGTPAVKIGERNRDLRYHLEYRPNWT